MWSVGDGQSINPFTDPWTPLLNGQLLRPRGGTAANGNEKVVDWIDPLSRAWREDVIRASVHQTDAEVVLNIHIPMNHTTDVFRWLNTSDGRITVRSAYHTIKNRQTSEVWDEETTAAPGTSILWSTI